MALLLLMPGRETGLLEDSLRALSPKIDLRVWPNIGAEEDIRFAVVWNYPKGILTQLSGLEAISSLGAGVDHILQDRDLPQNLRVVRIVDENLVQDMTRFVVGVVLSRQCRLQDYARQQSERKWLDLNRQTDETVTILGLGQLGAATAKAFVYLGFCVNGWSLTKKNLDGVNCLAGRGYLEAVLAETDYLINLLPLTAQTCGVLNARIFDVLRPKAYLINAARGEHLVEADLMAALDNEKLSGAWLDVFQEEPLPPEHPFWTHPKITVTPHIASATNPESVAAQIIENYGRTLAGRPLLHEVDRRRGY